MRFFTAFIFFTIVSCSTSKEVKKDTNFYEIENAYYQKWVAGVKGGGSGINLHIIFKEPLNDDFELEKFSFQSYEGVFEKISETEYAAKINTHQNDLILDENPIKEYGNKAPTENVLKTNEALLYFLIKSKGKYLARLVENVKEKPMLAYPSIKPKN